MATTRAQGVLDELWPILTTYDIDELPTFAGYTLVAAQGEKARQWLDQILSPPVVQPSLGHLPAVARV